MPQEIRAGQLPKPVQQEVLFRNMNPHNLLRLTSHSTGRRAARYRTDIYASFERHDGVGLRPQLGTPGRVAERSWSAKAAHAFPAVLVRVCSPPRPRVKCPPVQGLPTIDRATRSFQSQFQEYTLRWAQVALPRNNRTRVRIAVQLGSHAPL